MDGQTSIRRNGIMLINYEPGMGYALFVALLPVLMMYKVPAAGIGVSTAMIIVGFFYAVLAIFRDFQANGRIIRVAAIIILPVVYCLYAALRSYNNMTNAIQTLLLVFHIAAISTGAVNAKFLKQCIILIAMAAASLVLIQTLLHYSLGFHLPCIVPDLCLDNLAYYRGWITTGYPDVENLYRPSAFFLEPSHLSHYCFVAVAFCLFDGKPDRKKALWISLGMMLTTSGMGAALVGGIWCWYGLINIRSSNLTREIIRGLVLCIVAVMVLVIMMQIPFFQRVLSRIISPVEYSSQSYNAIWGRTLYWDAYILDMNSRDLMFGVGYGRLPPDYFTGLMELIFFSGMTGCILFYLSLIPFIASRSSFVRCVAVILGGLMVLANLSGFITLIYIYGSMAAVLTNRKESDGICEQSCVS